MFSWFKPGNAYSKTTWKRFNHSNFEWNDKYNIVLQPIFIRTNNIMIWF